MSYTIFALTKILKLLDENNIMFNLRNIFKKKKVVKPKKTKRKQIMLFLNDYVYITSLQNNPTKKRKSFFGF